MENPFLVLIVSTRYSCESSKPLNDSPWLHSVSSRTPGFSTLFMQHAGAVVVCCLHLAIYSSVFLQTPTRGQDNTSVEISEGERVE